MTRNAQPMKMWTVVYPKIRIPHLVIRPTRTMAINSVLVPKFGNEIVNQPARRRREWAKCYHYGARVVSFDVPMPKVA